MVLLQVCRVWQNIVVSTTALWNQICFAPKEIIKLLTSLRIERFVTSIACTSSKQLAHAIRRLRNTKFELVCCLIPDLSSTDITYWEGLEPIWFEEQCRALSLLVEGPLERFPHMFHKMRALEELTVSDMNLSFLGLLREIEEFSPSLRTLELQGVFPPEISQFTMLLGRLKHLSVESSFSSSRCLSELLSSANSLEKVHWAESTRSDFVVPLVPSSSAITHITLISSGISVFSGSGVYARVVDLEIKFTNKNAWPFDESQLEVDMPLLQTLTLEGKWIALRNIRAPTLRTLLLRRSKEVMKERLDALHKTGLRPDVLRIDRCVAESELISALRGTWKDIKELHISLSSRNDYMRDTLVKALSGSQNEGPLCHNLRALTVLFLKPEIAQGGIKGLMARSMREIILGRGHLGQLELLRCGWVQWAGRGEESGMESWPNQEWLDFI